MAKLTQEQEKDIQDRKTKFVAGYQELCKKYRCDLIGVPQFAPVSDMAFGVICPVMPIDTKYLDIPSPIQKENIL